MRKNIPGYTSEQSIEQEELEWKVLRVNNNTIELISSTPTSKSVYFGNALGYNNAVYLLNNFCNTLYGNSSKGATARSLNIEDLQNTLNLQVWDYHDYTTATKTKYGEVYCFKTSLTYPYQWTQERNSNNKIDGNETTGTLGSSEQAELTEQTSSKASTSIEAQQTEWRRKMDTSDFIDDIYYQLFINNSTNYSKYWLASRNVYASGSDCAGFGIWCIQYGWVDNNRLFYSGNYGSKLSGCIRPVVSLPLSAIDTSTDYETTETWNLK